MVDLVIHRYNGQIPRVVVIWDPDHRLRSFMANTYTLFS
jgi:hypothetical protein